MTNAKKCQNHLPLTDAQVELIIQEAKPDEMSASEFEEAVAEVKRAIAIVQAESEMMRQAVQALGSGTDLARGDESEEGTG